MADLDVAAAEMVASEIGATPLHVDVANPGSNDRLIDETENRFGPVDLFCANAGIGLRVMSRPRRIAGTSWQVNLMSHVHAARRLIPGWLARGRDTFYRRPQQLGSSRI